MLAYLKLFLPMLLGLLKKSATTSQVYIFAAGVILGWFLSGLLGLWWFYVLGLGGIAAYYFYKAHKATVDALLAKVKL